MNVATTTAGAAPRRTRKATATKQSSEPAPRVALPAELLTIREVGAFLRLSRSTINSYIGSGKLRVVRLSARSIRVTAESIAELIGARG